MSLQLVFDRHKTDFYGNFVRFCRLTVVIGFFLFPQYYTSDDFYFSGHVGCAILAALEHRSNHNW